MTQKGESMVVGMIVYTKKQRKWIKTHIYRVCQFRKFLKEEDGAQEPGQKTRFRQKKEHVGKLLAKHMANANADKIFSDGQITNLNLDIRRYIDQGNKPKQIIQEVLGKKQNESSPSTPGPIV